jgi:divalent metal cation (Fe/Co/Zn/Cd) transporter
MNSSPLLISISVVVGLGAAWLGLELADLLVSLAIAAMIGWAGWSRLRALSAILTDASVADVEQIAIAARQVERVQGVHAVRARGAAGAVRVDLNVAVDPAMPAAAAHELTHRVVDQVRSELGGIAEVLVHVGVDADETDHALGGEHEHWR